MKKVIRIVVLSAMLLWGGQAMSQTRGVVFLGAGLPMGDFGKFDNMNDLALYSENESLTYGGAGLGFNAGLKWYYGVGAKGLSVLLSLDGFYNGPCSDLKTAYRSQESEATFGGASVSLKYSSTPKYINVPLMLGLNYILRLNAQFGIYAEAGLGGNLRFITAMESVAKGTIPVLGEAQITTTQKYDHAFGFAWQVGAGFEVARNLVIGVSYYDLGSAIAKGDQTIKRKALNDNVSNTDDNYRELGTVHPAILALRLGFAF